MNRDGHPPDAPAPEAAGGGLRAWLRRAPPAVFAAYAIAAAFTAYFCMYAFRKPFAAAKFEGERFLDTDVELKTALVIGQVVGYTLSKYVGVRVVSEAPRGRRATLLVGLVLVAEAALALFAAVPGAWKLGAIFLNGLPLGLVWGLVVRYLEGRRSAELLLAGLSVSFIVASGVVKDVGRWLMAAQGVSEAAMPVATGALFLVPFVAAVWLLDQLPEPDAADEAARVARVPMGAAERRAFVARFLPGLALLLALYVGVSAYRDFRDTYGVELFAALGYGEAPAIFTRTELPVALGVVASLALLGLVKDNRRGLAAAFALMGVGALLVGVSTRLLEAGAIDGVTWMIASGLGSYLVYVPYNTVLFERLVAASGTAGTAVFGIYVADALGYTGSVALLLGKDLGAASATRLGFFLGLSYAVSAVGLLLLGAAAAYFLGPSRGGRLPRGAAGAPGA